MLESKDDTTVLPSQIETDSLLAWRLQAEEYKRVYQVPSSFLPAQKSTFTTYQFQNPQSEIISFALKPTAGDGDCFFHAVGKKAIFTRDALVRKLLDNPTETIRHAFAYEIRQFLYLGFIAPHANSRENGACQRLLTADIKERFLILQKTEEELRIKVGKVRSALGEKETHGKHPSELLTLLHEKSSDLTIEFEQAYQAVLQIDNTIYQYCCQGDVFRNYIQFYLKEARGYIPFSRDFYGARHITTIDAINELFGLKIQVYLLLNRNGTQLQLANQLQTGEVIPIFHNGINHFCGLEKQELLLKSVQCSIVDNITRENINAQSANRNMSSASEASPSFATLGLVNTDTKAHMERTIVITSPVTITDSVRVDHGDVVLGNTNSDVYPSVVRVVDRAAALDKMQEIFQEEKVHSEAATTFHFVQKSNTETIVLLDVDNCLVMNNNLDDQQAEGYRCNTVLLSALKKAELTAVYLFTAYVVRDVAQNAEAELISKPSCLKLKTYLESQGFEIKAVVTILDVIYNQGIGAYYRDIIEPYECYVSLGEDLRKGTHQEHHQKACENEVKLQHESDAQNLTKGNLFAYTKNQLQQDNQINTFIFFDDKSEYLRLATEVNQQSDPSPLLTISVKPQDKEIYYTDTLQSFRNYYDRWLALKTEIEQSLKVQSAPLTLERLSQKLAAVMPCNNIPLAFESHLEAIENLYRTFIENPYIQPKPISRHLSPETLEQAIRKIAGVSIKPISNAPLYKLWGYGNSPLYLAQKTALTLLSEDIHGNLIKYNTQGNGRVSSVGGVFFKRPGLNALQPLTEAFIFEMSECLGGEFISPTRALIIEKPNQEKVLLQASLGVGEVGLDTVLIIPGGIEGLRELMGEAALRQALPDFLSEQYFKDWLAKHPDSLNVSPKDYFIQHFTEDRWPTDFCARYKQNLKKSGMTGMTPANALEQALLFDEQVPCLKVLALMDTYPCLLEEGSLSNIASLPDLFYAINQIYPNVDPNTIIEHASTLLNCFSKKNYAQHFLLSLLTGPGDGKGDNFRVNILREKGLPREIKIIGIDNDIAFKQGFHKGKPESKTIIYALKSLLNTPIDRGINETLSLMFPNDILLKILSRVIILKTYYESLCNKLYLDFHEKNTVLNTFRFDDFFNEGFCEQFLLLLPQIFGVKTLPNPAKLWSSAYPGLAMYYEALGQESQKVILTLYNQHANEKINNRYHVGRLLGERFAAQKALFDPVRKKSSYANLSNLLQRQLELLSTENLEVPSQTLLSVMIETGLTPPIKRLCLSVALFTALFAQYGIQVIQWLKHLNLEIELALSNKPQDCLPFNEPLLLYQTIPLQNPWLIEGLASYGFDLNLPGPHPGYTPFQYAARFNFFNALIPLTTSGANIEALFGEKSVLVVVLAHHFSDKDVKKDQYDKTLRHLIALGIPYQAKDAALGLQCVNFYRKTAPVVCEALLSNNPHLAWKVTLESITQAQKPAKNAVILQGAVGNRYLMPEVFDEIFKRCSLRLMSNSIGNFEAAIKEENEIIITNNNGEFVIFYKNIINGEIDNFSCSKDLKALLLPLTFNGEILVKNQKSEELYKLVFQEVTSKGGCTFLKDRGFPKQNIYGRHNVTSVEVPITPKFSLGIHFKENPEFVGREIMVHFLGKLLFGNVTPEVALFKFTKKTTFLWRESEAGYPVLATQTVPGNLTLQDILDEPQELAKIEPISFAQSLLLTLLINPEDGRGDNYMLTPIFINGQHRYRLVSIDNDRAFVRPLNLNSDGSVVSGPKGLNVKTVLYCLNQMMSPLTSSVVQTFLNHEPFECLSHWLKTISIEQETINVLFSKEEHAALQDAKINLQMVFKPSVVADIYEKFICLQHALRDNPMLSGMNLLCAAMPVLGYRYQKVFNQFETPQQRFDTLTEGCFEKVVIQKTIADASGQKKVKTITSTKSDRNKILAITGASLEQKSIMEQFWAKEEPSNPQVAFERLREIHHEESQLAEIQAEVLQGKYLRFSRLLRRNQEAVINGQGLLLKSLDFSLMKKPDGTIDGERQYDFLNLLSKHSFVSLRIDGCQALTNLSLKMLLNGSKETLKVLELRACHALSNSALLFINLQCSHLEKLSLIDLIFQDEINFASNPFSTLRVLSLENCLSVKILRLNAPVLERIFIKNSNIRTFSTQSEILTSLRLIDCREFSEQEIFEASKNLKSLSEVSIKNCPKVSNAVYYECYPGLLGSLSINRQTFDERVAAQFFAILDEKLQAKFGDNSVNIKKTNIFMETASAMLYPAIALLFKQQKMISDDLDSSDEKTALAACQLVLQSGFLCLLLPKNMLQEKIFRKLLKIRKENEDLKYAAIKELAKYIEHEFTVSDDQDKWLLQGTKDTDWHQAVIEGLSKFLECHYRLTDEQLHKVFECLLQRGGYALEAVIEGLGKVLDRDYRLSDEQSRIVWDYLLQDVKTIDSSWQNRKAVVRRLGKLLKHNCRLTDEQSHIAWDFLLQEARDTGPGNVKQAAIEELGKFLEYDCSRIDEQLNKVFEQLLQGVSDGDSGIRKAALAGLSKLLRHNSRLSEEQLSMVECLLQGIDNIEDCVREAIQALAKLQECGFRLSDEQLCILFGYLPQGIKNIDRDIRQIIDKRLDNLLNYGFRLPEEQSEERLHKVFACLLQGIKNVDSSARMTAFEKLVELLKYGFSSFEERLRVVFECLLQGIKDTSWRDVYQSGRKIAFERLAKLLMHDPRMSNEQLYVVRKCLLQFKDTDWNVREAAFGGLDTLLGQISHLPEKQLYVVLECLFQGLKDESGWVRENTFKRLAKLLENSFRLSDEQLYEVLECLLQGIKDTNREVKEAVVIALGVLLEYAFRLSEKQLHMVLECLLRELKENTHLGWPRDITSERLGKLMHSFRLSDEQLHVVFGCLLQGIKDRDWNIRETAFEALAELLKRDLKLLKEQLGMVFEYLLQGIQDTRWGIREAAFEGLGNLLECGFRLPDEQSRRVFEHLLQGIKEGTVYDAGGIFKGVTKLLQHGFSLSEKQLHMVLAHLLQRIKEGTVELARSIAEELAKLLSYGFRVCDEQLHEVFEFLLLQGMENPTRDNRHSSGSVFEGLMKLLEHGFRPSEEQLRMMFECLLQWAKEDAIRGAKETWLPRLLGHGFRPSDEELHNVLDWLLQGAENEGSYYREPAVRGLETLLEHAFNLSEKQLRMVLDWLLRGTERKIKRYVREIAVGGLGTLLGHASSLSEKQLRIVLDWLLQEAKNADSSVREGIVEGLGKLLHHNFKLSDEQLGIVFECFSQGAKNADSDIREASLEGLNQLSMKQFYEPVFVIQRFLEALDVRLEPSGKLISESTLLNLNQNQLQNYTLLDMQQQINLLADVYLPFLTSVSTGTSLREQLYVSNAAHCFLVNSFSIEENFQQALVLSIGEILGQENDPAWLALPKRLFLPFTWQKHWAAAILDCDYQNSNFVLLWDSVIDERAFKFVLPVIHTIVDKLIKHYHGTFKCYTLTEITKGFSQQGLQKNLADDGPILLQNIEDMLKHPHIPLIEFAKNDHFYTIKQFSTSDVIRYQQQAQLLAIKQKHRRLIVDKTSDTQLPKEALLFKYTNLPPRAESLVMEYCKEKPEPTQMLSNFPLALEKPARNSRVLAGQC